MHLRFRLFISNCWHFYTVLPGFEPRRHWNLENFLEGTVAKRHTIVHNVTKHLHDPDGQVSRLSASIGL
jgi:hypothetical protein